MRNGLLIVAVFTAFLGRVEAQQLPDAPAAATVASSDPTRAFHSGCPILSNLTKLTASSAKNLSRFSQEKGHKL